MYFRGRNLFSNEIIYMKEGKTEPLWLKGGRGHRGGHLSTPPSLAAIPQQRWLLSPLGTQRLPHPPSSLQLSSPVPDAL